MLDSPRIYSYWKKIQFRDIKLVTYKHILLLTIFFSQSAFSSERDLECDGYKNWLTENVGEVGTKEYDSHFATTNLSHSLIWENDAFLKSGDRHYTNGMKLTWLHNPCREIWWDIVSPSFRKLAAKVFQTDLDDIRIGTGGVFGMNMYTPEIIDPARQRPSDPVIRREIDDRPYAGWLYGGISYSASVPPVVNDVASKVFVPGTSTIVIEFQFGVIGPAAAQEYAQTWVHKDLNYSENIPQGWKYQVPNQIGLNLQGAFQQNWFTANNFIRLTPVLGTSIGNFINFVNGGGIVAVGIPYVGKPSDDFVYTTIQPAFMKSSFVSDSETEKNSTEFGKSNSHAEIIFGFDVRYIHNSVFIEGTGEARHDIELTNIVYDLIVGISYGLKKCDCSISLRKIKRSSEFTRKADGSPANSHTLGQFVLDWYF